MSFFNSEIVQDELKEISNLQERLYGSMFTFSEMSVEGKIEHIEFMEKLLEKQTVVYQRLCLSDDPEAKEMKQRILDSAAMMGLDPREDMNILFRNMVKLLKTMRKKIEEDQ
jgi:hypothetical protein|tara:strand:+ start:8025 stop:8360 length:336 start_codon:yes stop_codon:yes gene_type:complete